MNKHPMHVQLHKLAEINLGYPFRGRIKESLGSEIVAVQMKNVSLQEGVDWGGCIKTKLKGKSKPEWLQSGDILFAARGNRNYAAVIDQTLENRKAVASPHFYVIRCNQSKVIPAFLASLLNHGPSQRYFERESEGTQTKSIRRDVLANTQIALPSLAEQQKVAQLMGTIQRQQQLLQAQLHNNQKLMAGIATELFQNQQGGKHV